MGKDYFKVSLAICTYNRSSLLYEALKAIYSEIKQASSLEVLVIDNKSTDNTKEVVSIFKNKTFNLEYILEQRQGLSHARNRAFKEAKGKWVVFIDDDARIRTGYINRLNWVIDNFDFDCFGGMYYAWYLQKKPKWIPDSFGTKISLRNEIGLIDGSKGWLSGGNFAISKKVLHTIGGFDTSYGMRGNRIGYGEEWELQVRLLKHGYKIGFDPELAVDHVVLNQKHKLAWHLRSAFQHGITRKMMQGNESNLLLSYLNLFRSTLGLFIKRLPLATFNIITRDDYYIQNLILDCFGPLFTYAGLIYSSYSPNR